MGFIATILVVIIATILAVCATAFLLMGLASRKA